MGRVICLETVSLQEQKVKTGSLGPDLGNQARFADPCLPTNQGNPPLTSFRLVNECMKGCQVGRAANQDRANDWLIAR